MDFSASDKPMIRYLLAMPLVAGVGGLPSIFAPKASSVSRPVIEFSLQ
jgi:hypothetical protein